MRRKSLHSITAMRSTTTAAITPQSAVCAESDAADRCASSCSLAISAVGSDTGAAAPLPARRHTPPPALTARVHRLSGAYSVERVSATSASINCCSCSTRGSPGQPSEMSKPLSTCASAAVRSSRHRLPSVSALCALCVARRSSCSRAEPSARGSSGGVMTTPEESERCSHPVMCRGSTLNSQPPGHHSKLMSRPVPRTSASATRHARLPGTTAVAGAAQNAHRWQRQKLQSQA
eukprot:scaffold15072_cov68-Phaeocystis_antarctica.AAC.1